MTNKTTTETILEQEAMKYHTDFPYGKVFVNTKECSDYQMRLAYSPGVAYPCEMIKKDPHTARYLTMKGNNVVVITNGTAVLGLGDIGALAGKPVMEGKALLMSKLAGIDATDLCIQEHDLDKMYEFIKACSTSFGCINLEDIAAPGCFTLLKRLQDSLDMPVFHDDQDGTAVVTTAALISGLKLVKKNISNIKIVCSGAGAAMLSTLKLLCEFGLDAKNVILFDSKGVVHNKRANLDEYKSKYAIDDDTINIQAALHNADVFLGLSAGGVLQAEDILVMNDNPIILAMANPTPEILPSQVHQVRKDAIMGTGRSDYPNQVNNVSCFPFLFRGVLDSQSRKITLNMLKGVVEGIVSLLPESELTKEKIIPNVTDQRLPYVTVNKVIQAAIEDNVHGEVNYYSMHMYLYKVHVWKDIIEQKSVSNVAITGKNAQILQSYINVFANANAKNMWTINIQENMDTNIKGIYIFRNGLSVFCVNHQAKIVPILNLEYYDIDLHVCMKMHELICIVNADDHEVYIHDDLRKAMFAVGLFSRVQF